MADEGGLPALLAGVAQLQQRLTSHAQAGSQSKERQQGVFVDAVTGRHAATSAADLLASRRMTWNKHYGWTYDAWVDDPARYALSGANGRFSLPALAQGFAATVKQAVGSAAVVLQQVQQVQGRGGGAEAQQQQQQQAQAQQQAAGPAR